MEKLFDNLPYIVLLSSMIGWGLRRFKVGMVLFVLSLGSMGYMINGFLGMFIGVFVGLSMLIFKRHRHHRGSSSSTGGGISGGGGAGRSY